METSKHTDCWPNHTELHQVIVIFMSRWVQLNQAEEVGQGSGLTSHQQAKHRICKCTSFNSTTWQPWCLVGYFCFWHCGAHGNSKTRTEPGMGFTVSSITSTDYQIQKESSLTWQKTNSIIKSSLFKNMKLHFSYLQLLVKLTFKVLVSGFLHYSAPHWWILVWTTVWSQCGYNLEWMVNVLLWTGVNFVFFFPF